MNLLSFDIIHGLLQAPSALTKHIIRRLQMCNSGAPIFPTDDVDWPTASAVLFLLGRYPGKDKFFGQPCLILNKRSAKVRQPGDLCCPGGRVSPRLDAGLGKVLRLPMLPLARWPYWHLWRRKRAREAEWLRLLLATGIRESVEEMRLNPFGLRFLGPLPAQPLFMFQRVIYPMAVWVSGQQRFFPNWEVEKIIYIPLRELLNPSRYVRYQLKIEFRSAASRKNTFACFRYEQKGMTELLWGATYRITAVFLDYVFGFVPPDLKTLPEIHGRLSRS
jgi:hypothetical protein